MKLGDWWWGFTPAPILQHLEETQYWPRERLEELQLQSLRDLLQHAGEHVPFYRDVFRDLGFDPRDLRSLQDITALPIVDKATILSQVDRFVSAQAPKPLVWLKTGGSTGEPFRFVRTRLDQSYKLASRLRFRGWYGISRTDPCLNIGGLSYYSDNRQHEWFGKLHFFLTNKVGVYASDLHGAGLETVAQLIERYRIKYIMGYPTGIVALAEFIHPGRPLTHYPQAIFSNSETLFDWLREPIKAGFGIDPRDEYTATEGSIAVECPHGSMHVNMEETLLEFIPLEQETEVQEAIVTFLHTFDFPLIRYRIGDVGTWGSPCSCGRGLATIERVIGRYADAIVMPDGRRFTAATLNMRLAHYSMSSHIRQYQLAQLSPEHLELRVVAAPGAPAAPIQAFHEAIADIFHPLTVAVVPVENLTPEKSGKIRPVIGLAGKA